ALGLIPHFAEAARLPAEDAVALDRRAEGGGGDIVIAVPRLAHIANFDDLDPLKLEPSVRLVIVHPGEPLPGDADLVILPGSKATLADLRDFRRNGWDIDLKAHARRGGRVLGLCGGYQMLGRTVADPDGIEGPPGSEPGLGLLDVDTILSADKSLEPVRGTTSDGAPFAGYEMHIGTTDGPDRAHPFARLAGGTPEGATAPNGRIAGTYIHGLFADDRQRAAWLKRLSAGPSAVAYEDQIERTLDALAAHLAAHLDLEKLLTLAR